MNWLAHALLSEPTIEFRMGNLLADLVRRDELEGMPAAFLAGVAQHQRIDAFTDSHPTVRQSRARVRGRFGHATGILVDVFYDHFLAVDFKHYAGEPLDAFTARLYADMQQHDIALPADAREAVERMVVDDPLGSYATRDGIETALRRVSRRLTARTGRNLGLERGVDELDEHFDALRGDFAVFFPELQTHSAAGVGSALPPGTRTVPYTT